jgi:replicative DNA helicase
MRDIDPALYKLPPQTLEAEQSILGGILLENGTINAALEIIGENDFYSEAHRKIFSVVAELADNNEPVDLITLGNALKNRSLLDAIGGVAYLASLVDNVPSAANVANYAKIVKEKAVLRGLIGSATDIINSCYETGSDIDEVLDKAEHSIFEISENKIRPSFHPMKDIVRDSFKAIEELFARKELITGVPTGFDKIDDMTSGLQNSDLIIIAGRPSMANAFALNIAQHAALETQIPVAFFRLEMSKEQLAFRMLAPKPAWTLKGCARDSWGNGLAETDGAAGRLSEAPFHRRHAAISVLEMKAKSAAQGDQGLG